jgi:hypothetical protein
MRRLRRAAVGILAALVVVLAGGSAASASWVAWHRVRALDQVRLTGLSCPSVRLCVAIDRRGKVLVSTSPTVAGAVWKAANVDPGNALSGISCPSRLLCVAVDRAGNVLTSSDPSGGGRTWSIASLGRGKPLTAVSCATVSLCVAGDTTALVSTNPTGGASTWVDTGAGATTYYACIHDPTPDCDAPVTAISCLPAPVQCVTFNDAGGFGVSSDPAGGAREWTTVAAAAGELLGGSCLSHVLCVGTCPVAVTAGSDNCAPPAGGYESGAAVTWTPRRPQAIPSFMTLTSDNLTGVWCAAGEACFTTDGVAPPGLFSSGNGPGRGELFVSTDPIPSQRPRLARHTWTIVYRDLAGITSISCPTTLCLGVDAAGNLLAGERPSGVAEVKASLRSVLADFARTRVSTHRGRLLHATYRITVPHTGTLDVRWDTTTPHGRQLVATGSAYLVEGTPGQLKLRLTHRGSQILRAGRRPDIAATAQFAEPDGTTVTQQLRFSFPA